MQTSNNNTEEAEVNDPGSTFMASDWGGMNVNAARQYIGDDEFAWLENVLPVGPGNGQIVPGNMTLAGGFTGTVVSLFEATIAGVSYLIVQTNPSAGSYNVYAVQISTGAVTTLSTATTLNYFAMWKNQYLLVINSAAYSQWDPVGGFVSIGGQTGGPIAVWGGRVWIAQGTGTRTLVFSAPNSFSDFTLADAGGNVVITDAALQGAITSLITAGDWLYILGPGYVGALSEIQVLQAAPPVTLFNTTRVSGIMGVTATYAAAEFDGSLIVLNANGVTAFQGLTRNPLSAKMDGFIQNCDFTKNLGVAVTTLFNKLVLLCLVYYTPNAQYYLMGYMEGKWFLLNVGKTVTAVAWAVVNSGPQGYYSDGVNVYSIGTSPSTGVTGIVQTKLYDGGNPVTVKEIRRHGMEISFVGLDGQMNFTLDTYDPDQGLQQVPYDVSDISKEYSNGYQWVRQMVDQYGTYFGTTLNFTLTGGIIQSFGYNLLYGNEWP